eukprot:COSAG01_NODE_3640_length_5838_cov_4.263286_8_plen_117_part_00
MNLSQNGRRNGRNGRRTFPTLPALVLAGEHISVGEGARAPRVVLLLVAPPPDVHAAIVPMHRAHAVILDPVQLPRTFEVVSVGIMHLALPRPCAPHFERQVRVRVKIMGLIITRTD